MTARIPLCCVCGTKTSARTGRVIMQWQGVAGRPMIAAHLDCQKEIPWKHGDPLAPFIRWLTSQDGDRLRLFGRVSLEECIYDAAEIDGIEAVS